MLSYKMSMNNNMSHIKKRCKSFISGALNIFDVSKWFKFDNGPRQKYLHKTIEDAFEEDGKNIAGDFQKTLEKVGKRK
jgi:hypothetical protein